MSQITQRGEVVTNSLTGQVVLAGRTAGSRVVFGPHETNLCRGRTFSERSVAYYARRARGGAGILVTEFATVRAADHPYERAPRAADCGPGWAAIVAACRPHRALVLAGLTDSGGQGSTAYCRDPLVAPSPLPDPGTRELPRELDADEIPAIVDAFAAAARVAVDSGADGVEIDAGPLALARAFASGLTNQRTDPYGTDRLRFLREVLAAVRTTIGADHLLSLRLSCDEHAPWAGVTPGVAASYARDLAAALDLLVVVRGGPMDPAAYRPDAHIDPGFNRGLAAEMRAAVAGAVPVVLQGSMFDPAMAQRALDDGAADLVEMTRAQIADPDLVRKWRSGFSPRPCTGCNQACLVRDPMNPIVTCPINPRAGHETLDTVTEPGSSGRSVLVVGGGPAGLTAARILAVRGFDVTLRERSERLGGMLARIAVGPSRKPLVAWTDWLAAECHRLGVRIETGTPVDAGTATIVATGSVAAPPEFVVAGRAALLTAPGVLDGEPLRGPVLLHDPLGGPVAIALAELLAERGYDTALVTPDRVAGKHLAQTGDLVAANTRLQRAGIVRHLATRIRRVDADGAVLEDVHTGTSRRIPCATVVDCGHRYADPARVAGVRVGDCVAPRTVLEAVREARAAALVVAP